MRFTHNDDSYQKSSNVNKICFQPMLMTFICNIKIDIIMCEPQCVKLFFFVDPLLICLFTFDIFLTI